MPENAPATEPPEVVESAPPFQFRFAWQPLTPRGVARFADNHFGNLFLVQMAVALVVTAAICWFIFAIWFPVIRQGIGRLPQSGSIRDGELRAPASTFIDNRFLGLMVNPGEQSETSLSGDIRIHAHRSQLVVCSLFGCLRYPYLKNYTIQVNRPEGEPWWGAWQPIILGMVAVAVPMVLFGLWTLLATLYCPAGWLISFYTDRSLSWGGSWRLASAALMPGALLLAAAVVGYGLGAIDLIRLLLAAALHIIVGWIYLVAGCCARPKLDSKASGNPFVLP